MHKPLSRVLWWLLSAPVFVKVLGIGGLIAVMFAGVTLYNIRGNMAQTLYETLEQTTVATADSLSRRLERPMLVDDLFTVRRDLGRAMATFPEVRYIIVQDARGRNVAHTFAGGIPSDLLRVAPQAVPAGGTTQVLGTSEGLIIEATTPILKGGAGRVRVGVSDTAVTQELASMTRSVLWTLAVCLMVAGALGLGLTYVMMRPIHRLVLATDRVRAGDFQSKAEVLSDDEIGKLARAFNRMAEALHDYRQEVEEKEAARRALLERVVLAQEEERRRIARELHDQLGQSLSTLLLGIESAPRNGGISGELRQHLEDEVRALIDRVRILAWNMRPSILDDYGLDSALERHVEQLSKRFD
ncbi:MAG: HAMP domain-containing protein, partial [Armatimonadota bacterium]